MVARETIGFIGVGTMGQPMARCLSGAGFRLVVNDVNYSSCEEFAAEIGAKVASKAKDVAEAAQIVVTMLPSGADVRAVALGADGLAGGFQEGSILIDMSSSEPSGTQALAAELAERGIHMIDAPVSGGRAKAVDGTLTLIVGGETAVIDRCQAVLEAMGDAIFRTGAVGSGHAIKALNNLLNAIGLLAGAEALAIGKKFGLDLETVVDVVNASTGMNHATQNKFKQRVFSRSFDSGFALDLMVKDLDIALALARETKTPVPFSAQAREIWAAAGLNLGPGQDHTDLVRWVEQTAKTELS